MISARGQNGSGRRVLCGAFAVFSALARLAIADDVGDTAGAAEALHTGTVVRAINPRHDRDVFRWTALPYTTNSITVSTGSIWDVEVDLLAPSGVAILSYTNTAAGLPVTVTVISTTVARRCYLRIGSLAEFTTGSYSIAYSRSFTDADADGLPDGWELAHFASLTNASASGDADGDGMPDSAEWLAGTHPGDSTSQLRITQIQVVTNWLHISWTTQPEGLYRITRATSPPSGWFVVAPEIVAASNSAVHPAGPAETSAVVRVELVY